MQKLPDEITSQARVLLEAQKKSTAGRIEALSLQDPYANSDRTNDNASLESEAGEQEGHARQEALVVALTKQLDDIDDALVRIGNGTYGICSKCGQPIETARLKIIPTATLCVADE